VKLRFAGAVALALAGVLVVPLPAQAADSGSVQVDVSVNGKVVTDQDIVLDPAVPAQISIRVSNNGDTAQRVKTFRLSGSALGLTFLAYDTTVSFDVAPRTQLTRAFPLDLGDLGNQAIGLLPAKFELLDPDRNTVAEVSSTADVKGSVTSVYGVFGLAVLLLTALAWAGALIALARHRLPANRFRRALRFLPAGVGTGLTAVITLSVLRLMAPAPAAEIPLVLGAAAVALVLGYLTPHPNRATAAPIAQAPAGATQAYPSTTAYEVPDAATAYQAPQDAAAFPAATQQQWAAQESTVVSPDSAPHPATVATSYEGPPVTADWSPVAPETWPRDEDGETVAVPPAEPAQAEAEEPQATQRMHVNPGTTP
jgi:hypothetical protein